VSVGKNGLLLLLTCNLLACASSSPEVATGVDWVVVLTMEQISRVRETFPDYEPPKASPAARLSNPAQLTRYSYQPARFFKAPSPTGYRLISKFGLRVENNGYECPPNLLKRTGTYFSLQGSAVPFELRQTKFDPRNSLRGRMGVPPLQTHSSPIIASDYAMACADLEEIENVIAKTKEAIAAEFPETALVQESDLQITIEPTIFWVAGSNFGDTWAGGATKKDGSQYQIRVILFYVSQTDFRIADWREFLVWEMTNYYLLKIGRPEFVF